MTLRSLYLFVWWATVVALSGVILRSCIPNEPGGNPTPVPQVMYFQPAPAPYAPPDFRWAQAQSPDYTQRQPTPTYDGYCRQITSHLTCCYRYRYEPTPQRGPTITPRIVGVVGTGCYEVP